MSNFSRCVMRPQTTHCAGLLTSEGGTPMPRIGLLLSCVPVGWRVSLLKRLGGCRFRPWQRSTWGGASGYDALGGYSIDLVESGLIIMFHSEIISLALSLFISGVSPTWPLRFSRTTRWGSLLIVGPSKGVLLETSTQAKYFLGFYSHLSLTSQLSSTGGNIYPFSW